MCQFLVCFFAVKPTCQTNFRLREKIKIIMTVIELPIIIFNLNYYQSNSPYAFKFYYIDFHSEAMHNAYSPPLATLSLVKSREMLQKITSNLDSIESNRQNSIMIQAIQTSSQKIQHSIDNKIEQNFNLILNAPTLMPLDSLNRATLEKENNLQANSTTLEGSKALMYHYWQRTKKSVNNQHNKSVSVKSIQARRSQSKLPSINQQSSEMKIASMIKAKQKSLQFMDILVKTAQPKEQFHIKIKIVDYKMQNESKSFFKFQKAHFKRWKEIQTILKALEKFAEYYHIQSLTINTKSIFELIERVSKGWKMITHDLLGCCQNAEQISEDNQKQAGIRFYGKAGKDRAVILIQSHVRRWLQSKRFKQQLLRWRSAKKIQSQFRCYLMQKALKQKILERQLQKLQKFNSLQKYFTLNFRKKQIQSRVKYQIHIPSHNYAEWQKVSMEKYLQKQNSELCRIFKIAQSNPLCDVRIIYVSPIALSKQIVNYYKKLIELASDQQLEHKLIILTPEHSHKMPVSLSLTQLLYYSTKTLNKIKKIVKNNYSYIVPSTPSNDYIHICHYLAVPLYGSNPQKLNYLSTKAGCKSFQEELTQKADEEKMGVLPYSVNIYSQSSLLNELTNLIYRYPYVKRWVLKIDNQSKSRGLAYIDVSKILGRLLSNLAEETQKNQPEKIAREQIYSLLQNSLIINKEDRIIPIAKDIYPSQDEFLQYYYTRGGIIEASINNFQSDLQNSCFCIDLAPDGEWSFLCSYYKITNKHKAIGAYYDSTLLQPPFQIDHIISKLKKQNLFGYFTLQFLSLNHQLQKSMKKSDNKVHYLNSIDCSLNQFSSAHYLRNLISKDSNALFVPLIQHPAIKQLRMQTFFHLCRLQNISFDIEKKVGNVFTFMDGLQSGCLGIMTFNQNSKEDCYAHSAEVLDFLNCKLRQTNSLKDIPASFFSVKNAVNGFLNRLKKKKIKSSKSMNKM